MVSFPAPLKNQSPISEQLPPKPFLTTKELRIVFREHLKRQIPEDDTYLITFVEGQLFKTSSAALPAPLHPKQDLMKHWSLLDEPQQGEVQVDGHIQSILYRAEPIQSHGKLLGVMVVAHTTGGEREEAFGTLVIVIEVMIGVLLVTLLLTWWVAGQVLKPLRRLAETAQAIGESDLTQRLSVQGDGEISQLARIFNEMMDRLQTAFSSQREFVNDAGHELKTPITIIQGHLELMGDDPTERQETLTLVMDELARMNRLVNDLLLLAKAERPDFLVLETIDVRTLTEELYAKVKTLADRHWQLETVGEGQLFLIANASQRQFSIWHKMPPSILKLMIGFPLVLPSVASTSVFGCEIQGKALNCLTNSEFSIGLPVPRATVVDRKVQGWDCRSCTQLSQPIMAKSHFTVNLV
jgi:HAMP domain-containing protein